MSINRRDFDMKEIKTVVQEIMDAPSCYPALREAAQDYLDCLGTDKEKEVAKKLLDYKIGRAHV